MTSDFEFALVGQPTYTYGGVVLAQDAATDEEMAPA